MKYKIVIPTYKRYDTIKEKTLNYLINICNIDKNNIDIWVANEQEKEEYEKSLSTYNLNIIVGVPTIKAQRNAIVDYYSVNDYIISMDDDIEGIYIKSGSKTKLFTDLESLIKDGYKECQRNKTKLWGICAVNNGFYMDYKISTNLKFIVACFFGMIIDKDDYLKPEIDNKEDYERTIKYFKKYGSVVRFNMFAPKTAYYKESGGLQDDNNRALKEKQSAIYLINKYPDLCKLNTKRKGGYTEVLLNSRAKNG